MTTIVKGSLESLPLQFQNRDVPDRDVLTPESQTHPRNTTKKGRFPLLAILTTLPTTALPIPCTLVSPKICFVGDEFPLSEGRNLGRFGGVSGE